MQKRSDKENVASYKSEFWGICCESGKRYSQVVRNKFHVSMAALDPTVVNTSSCVSLLVERAGSQYLLCNLKPGTVLQVNLDLFFDKGERITFFLKGHGTVHLSGYHIYSGDVSESPGKSSIVYPFKKRVNAQGAEMESSSEEEDESMEDEELEDVKKLKQTLGKVTAAIKKVTTPSATPAKKVQTTKATAKKKETSDEEEESSEDEESDEKTTKAAVPVKKVNASPKKAQTPKATPKQKKTESSDKESSDDDDLDEALNKKSVKAAAPVKKADVSSIKKADGSSIKKAQTPKATPKQKKTESSDEESSDDEDFDEELNKKSGADLKALEKYAANFTMKRQRPTADEESSDDEEESSEDDTDEAQNKKQNAQIKQNLNDFMNKKRLKMDTSTPATQPGNKKKAEQKTPKLFAEVIDLEESDSKTQKKSFSSSELNSSIGRTPMPKKSISSFTHLSNSLNSTLELKKNKSSADEDVSTDSADSPDKVQKVMDTSAQSTESKKKKKKKKNKPGISESQVESTPGKANESITKFKSGKKLPGGVEYEDIRTGNGLEARKGKLVHVYYSGKLNNNKVFDSRQPGNKPFSFKLGTGQVIKGWDIGVEGMKVGGKRRLKIPPHMGYKNQRMGDIPPNSTLHFVVELKAVS